MKKLRLIAGALVTVLMTATACEKGPDTTGQSKYLVIDHAYTNVGDRQGSTRIFKVESNVNWQLSVQPVNTPSADWMVLDKYTGYGTENITITATANNFTGQHRLAEVTASTSDDPSIAPVRMTVVQYDSTIKINK